VFVTLKNLQHTTFPDGNSLEVCVDRLDGDGFHGESIHSPVDVGKTAVANVSLDAESAANKSPVPKHFGPLALP
jgi:hypothetical protein